MRLIYKRLIGVSLLLLLGLITTSPPDVLAQAAGEVTKIENFLRQIIQVLASLAGLIATGFFVVGGFNYIISNGDPRAMQRAKRTLVFAGFGLIITIGAFVMSGLISEIARQAFGV